MNANKPSNKNNSYKRLFALMKPYKGRLIVAILLVLLSDVAYAMAPLLMGNATNSLAVILQGGDVKQDAKTFFTFLILMLGAYALNSVLTYISTWLIVNVTENTIFSLRKQVDHKLSKLPLNYYDTHSYGDILSRITNDVDTVSNSLQQHISSTEHYIYCFADTYPDAENQRCADFSRLDCCTVRAVGII